MFSWIPFKNAFDVRGSKMTGWGRFTKIPCVPVLAQVIIARGFLLWNSMYNSIVKFQRRACGTLGVALSIEQQSVNVMIDRAISDDFDF